MVWGQRDLALEQRWRERLAKWQSSGLSIRAFCELRGLTETSFYYWKRELRARDVAAAKSPAEKESRPTFVPVTVMPITTTAVEVRCPSGHVVCLPACGISALALCLPHWSRLPRRICHAELLCRPDLSLPRTDRHAEEF